MARPPVQRLIDRKRRRATTCPCCGGALVHTYTDRLTGRIVTSDRPLSITEIDLVLAASTENEVRL
jgi:hypothetical protein